MKSVETLAAVLPASASTVFQKIKLKHYTWQPACSYPASTNTLLALLLLSERIGMFSPTTSPFHIGKKFCIYLSKTMKLTKNNSERFV